MSKIKCVLFDMDGTLSDTLDDLTVALNVMLKFYNLPTRTRDEVRGMVGNGIDALILRGLPDTHKHLFDEGCGNIFRAYYKAHLTDYTRPYDGVNEVIDTLKAKGIKIGIGKMLSVGVHFFEAVNYVRCIRAVYYLKFVEQLVEQGD